MCSDAVRATFTGLRQLDVSTVVLFIGGILWGRVLSQLHNTACTALVLRVGGTVMLLTVFDPSDGRHRAALIRLG